MDDRHPLFEWSPGHNIDDNEQLIMQEYHENVVYYTETNVDYNDFQSRESN